MSAAEFVGGCEFYAMEPWGEERADLRAGIVAATMANCHAGKRGKAFEARDFMPQFGGKRRGSEPMTAEQMKSKMKMFAAMQNVRAEAVARRKAASDG